MIRYKKLPANTNQKIDLLQNFFKKDSNIVFAYLFGGLLKKRRSPLSDIDIAIYVKDTQKLDYLELFSRISNLLNTDEVDLIILNTAPISLAGRVLQGRKILIDKAPFLRHKYESVTLRKYFDFRIKEADILKRRYGIG